MGLETSTDIHLPADRNTVVASIGNATIEDGKVSQKDFFGRAIAQQGLPNGDMLGGSSANGTTNLPNGPRASEMANGIDVTDDDDVWLNYHEGFSRAVKKAVTLDEFLEAFT